MAKNILTLVLAILLVMGAYMVYQDHQAEKVIEEMPTMQEQIEKAVPEAREQIKETMSEMQEQLKEAPDMSEVPESPENGS